MEATPLSHPTAKREPLGSAAIGMKQRLPRKEVVLLGVGHTNAHLLRMWRMEAPVDVGLTCVSNFRKATYSGMLPGVLAGQYRPADMEIDLVRLTAANGARLVIGDCVGMDHEREELLFSDHAPVPFDVLSIGLGSVPSFAGVELNSERVLAIKPMQTLLGRLKAALTQWQQTEPQGPLRVAIVGGGAGGIEVAFCLQPFFHRHCPTHELQQTIIQGADQILLGYQPGTVERVGHHLRAAGIELITGQRVQRVDDRTLTLEDGRTHEADLVIWATGAAPPSLIEKLGLPVTDAGFLEVRDTLQVPGHDRIFAVGDTSTIIDHRLPKCGVYAVRQGPVLWRNIKKILVQRPVERFRPQRDFLRLLNLGDGRAIGEQWGRSFEGSWAWRWKDWIDRRFMAKYQDYDKPEMEMSSLPDEEDQPMRCAGCGGKVGASVLSAVLHELDVPARPEVLVGLDSPDDAAVLQMPPHPITVTTDFFTSPLADQYLVGRIAALNALSDVWAMGARPVAALTIAILPEGTPNAQQRVMRDLLAGGLEELRRADATLVGGHTIEGAETSLGFTIIADQGDTPPATKAGLQVGDRLVLTKALGTGTLLAAHMEAACRAPWMKSLVRSLLTSNQSAAELALRCGCSTMTDVTGFGLAGHLLEMLNASQLGARLSLDAIPLLPGFAECTHSGFQSSLDPANRTAETAMVAGASLRARPEYAALFDPQTNGGLLISLSEDAWTRMAQDAEDVMLRPIGVVTEGEQILIE